MFDHVTIRARDRETSERFYARVLRELEVEQTHTGDDFPEWDDFSLAGATAERPTTTGTPRRVHGADAAARQQQKISAISIALIVDSLS